MKKITLFSIAILMMFMAVAGLSSSKINAATDDVAPVSTGLRILAKDSAMAVSAVTGKELAFSPEDFERGLNQKRLGYITVTKAPDPALGTLYLGSEGVEIGKTISRENLHKLSYVEKTSGVTSNSFSFTTGNGYEVECSVYMLSKENYCPTIGKKSELYESVSTYRNVSVYGTLSGSDPDGDEITFEVVSYPENGFVTMLGRGEFRYTPYSEYTGKDSFKYVVKDKYGNYSASQTVSLEVKGTRLTSVLSDMGGNKAHAAAITMVEKGIMKSGEKDGITIFAPDNSVSREDFLVMVMKAAGLKYTEGQSNDGKAVKVNTGFFDDADISDEARNYVYLAKQKGFIKGSESGDISCFYPKRDITAAEAAVMIDNIIGTSAYVANTNATETVFADHLDIPVWAESSVRALNYIGVMADVNGYIYPEKAIDRATAAMMLDAVMKLIEN